MPQCLIGRFLCVNLQSDWWIASVKLYEWCRLVDCNSLGLCDSVKRATDAPAQSSDEVLRSDRGDPNLHDHSDCELNSVWPILLGRNIILQLKRALGYFRWINRVHYRNYDPYEKELLFSKWGPWDWCICSREPIEAKWERRPHQMWIGTSSTSSILDWEWNGHRKQQQLSNWYKQTWT